MGVFHRLSFDGRIGRRQFLTASLVLLVLQQILGHLLIIDYWFSPTAFLNQWLQPLLSWYFGWFIGTPKDDYRVAILVGLILLTDWALAVLAFRRMRTVAASPILAAVVVIPFIQLVSTLALTAMPERSPASLERGGCALEG